MTRDEIIKMAREAGFGPAVAWKECTPPFERFAALVAEAEREAIKAIIHEHDCEDGMVATDDVLTAIRRRGEK
jgi:hypothetical protein